MKYTFNYLHLLTLPVLFAAVSVVQGPSVASSLVVLSLTLPFLIVSFLEYKRSEQKEKSFSVIDLEISELEQELRKNRLVDAVEESKYQFRRQQIKRSSGNDEKTPSNQVIF